MGKLPLISGRQAVKAFSRAGWAATRQTGSHLILEKPGMAAILSVPQKPQLKRGLLRQLIKDSGLEMDEFLGLL